MSILIIGLSAYLYRLGGSESTLYRKLGVPILLSLLTGNLWIIPFGFVVFTVPLTIKGDSIKNAWWWVPIIGFLVGLVPMVGFEQALYFDTIYTLTVVLSNIKRTSQIFVWDGFEFLIGALLAYMTIS